VAKNQNKTLGEVNVFLELRFTPRVARLTTAFFLFYVQQRMSSVIAFDPELGCSSNLSQMHDGKATTINGKFEHNLRHSVPLAYIESFV
jgi:hypothetical protein